MNKTAFPNQRLWPNVKWLQPSQLRAAEEAVYTGGESLQGNLQREKQVSFAMSAHLHGQQLIWAVPLPCQGSSPHVCWLRISRGCRALADFSLHFLSLQCPYSFSYPCRLLFKPLTASFSLYRSSGGSSAEHALLALNSPAQEMKTNSINIWKTSTHVCSNSELDFCEQFCH